MYLSKKSPFKNVAIFVAKGLNRPLTQIIKLINVVSGFFRTKEKTHTIPLGRS